MCCGDGLCNVLDGPVGMGHAMCCGDGPFELAALHRFISTKTQRKQYIRLSAPTSPGTGPWAPQQGNGIVREGAAGRGYRGSGCSMVQAAAGSGTHASSCRIQGHIRAESRIWSPTSPPPPGCSRRSNAPARQQRRDPHWQIGCSHQALWPELGQGTSLPISAEKHQYASTSERVTKRTGDRRSLIPWE